MSKNKNGWQCPGCGVNYAPSVDRCECTKHAPVQRYDPYPYWPAGVWPYNYKRWWIGDPPNLPYYGTLTITSQGTNATSASFDNPELFAMNSSGTSLSLLDSGY